eukprot:CAMPEP_0117741610 /NCGR_PEP_ID=MMETSP0947-20121206/5030_1 /TAXON_ID=44440 /ORGANISM="Chattonella subsalsa, Strain CCMP2191" /LENGTH=595 /DNA_ID=CAMNT_0005557929 /DNA_START=40 /DNA_END=1824 /DNA_ORIENTATION=-
MKIHMKAIKRGTGYKLKKNIPQEELLQLSKKLSKRLKIMETRMQTLADSHKQVLAERDTMVESVRRIAGPIWENLSLPNDSNPTEDGTPKKLKKAEAEGKQQIDATHVVQVLEAYEANVHAQATLASERLEEELRKTKQELQQLQTTHQKQLLLLKAQLKDPLASKKKSDTAIEPGLVCDPFDTVQSEQRESKSGAGSAELMQQQLADLEAQLAILHADNMDLSMELEDMKNTAADRSITMEGIKSKCVKLEEENLQLKTKVEDILTSNAVISEMERNLSVSNKQIQYYKSELDALQEKFTSTKSKLMETEEKENNTRQELGVARQELTSVKATATRLQEEANLATNSHAARAALVASLQEDMQSLQEQLKFRDQDLAEKQAAADALQKDKLSLKEELKAQRESLEHLKQSMLTERGKVKGEHAKEIRKLEDQFKAEISTVLTDHKKKSALARQLLAEKDTQAKELEKQVAELQAEIDSGGHSERKIMQLAQAQASRDTKIKEGENKLKENLNLKIQELDEFKVKYHKLSLQVKELRREHRRGDVNMEYLKNVVVNYMSLNTSSSARKSLVPVISMLLQFSPQELQQVQSAHDNW